MIRAPLIQRALFFLLKLIGLKKLPPEAYYKRKTIKTWN